MYLLYDLLLLTSALVLVPWYLLRGVRYGKTRRGIRERLGFYAAERLAPLAGRGVIWVHAVSVGETRAAIPLVKALKASYPEHALVVSNVTETGHAIAREIGEIDLCLFFPFDLSWVVRRVLDRIRPDLIVIVETEIWPNFVRQAHLRGIPLALVNGRLSDRSFPRYRAVRALVRPLLEQFAAFCMQTELDAERIRQLGAPDERVEVTRNLKFDMQGTIPDAQATASLKEMFRLPEGIPVWVAGSTHAGEEEIVADTFRKLTAGGRQAILILVPRHPERCTAVAQMLSSRQIDPVFRSELEDRDSLLQSGEVVIGDTLGEMLRFYAVADLVFVGGSLVDIGGHNVLEASLLKKPALFGPHMHNFKEISRLLLEVRGGLQVADGEELEGAVWRLLEDPDMGREMGRRGHGLLEQNAGATAHTVKTLVKVMDGRG